VEKPNIDKSYLINRHCPSPLPHSDLPLIPSPANVAIPHGCVIATHDRSPRAPAVVAPLLHQAPHHHLPMSHRQSSIFSAPSTAIHTSARRAHRTKRGTSCEPAARGALRFLSQSVTLGGGNSLHAHQPSSPPTLFIAVLCVLFIATGAPTPSHRTDYQHPAARRTTPSLTWRRSRPWIRCRRSETEERPLCIHGRAGGSMQRVGGLLSDSRCFIHSLHGHPRGRLAQPDDPTASARAPGYLFYSQATASQIRSLPSACPRLVQAAVLTISFRRSRG
jgi:hypothetical protein